MSFRMERPLATVARRGSLRRRAALLLALRTWLRAGEARRSEPLRASKREYAQGFGVGCGFLQPAPEPVRRQGLPRPRGRGQGWGRPKGSKEASASPGGGSTRNDLNPWFTSLKQRIRQAPFDILILVARKTKVVAIPERFSMLYRELLNDRNFSLTECNERNYLVRVRWRLAAALVVSPN